MSEEDIVFADSQIGKGLKPLAQHGSIVIGSDGTFSLFGTDGDVIASAPISQVSAERVKVTMGQTVSVTVAEDKFNCTPGWGSSPIKVFNVFSSMKASKELVQLIESGGQVPSS